MRALGFCLLFCFCAQAGWSCAWTTGTNYRGGAARTSRFNGANMLRHALETNLAQDGHKMEESLRNAVSFRERNDYAVALMYLGRSAEAVTRLQELEKEIPGEYYIAANLGTAYELAGENEKALEWITEGIRRNSDSHYGTEWLHVKILEAKIAQEKDPDYFKKHSVLDLRPADVDKVLVIGSDKYTPSQLMTALQYQLSERLSFVKPPDAPVASLLFDYAALEAGTRTLESAIGILKMAVEYGYPVDQVNPLLRSYERRILWRKTTGYGFWVLIGAGVIAFLAYSYRRGWFVLSSRDLR